MGGAAKAPFLVLPAILIAEICLFTFFLPLDTIWWRFLNASLPNRSAFHFGNSVGERRSWTCHDGLSLNASEGSQRLKGLLGFWRRESDAEVEGRDFPVLQRDVLLPYKALCAESEYADLRTDNDIGTPRFVKIAV